MVSKRGRSSLNASIMASLQKMQAQKQKGVSEPEVVLNPEPESVIEAPPVLEEVKQETKPTRVVIIEEVKELEVTPTIAGKSVLTIEDTMGLTLPEPVLEEVKQEGVDESVKSSTPDLTDVFEPIDHKFDTQDTEVTFPIEVTEFGELVSFEFYFNGNQYKVIKGNLSLNLEDLTNKVLNISHQQWSDDVVGELHRHLELYWLQFNLVLVYQRKLWLDTEDAERVEIHLDDYYGVTVLY